jgi:uncharacterized RDD family membrane protein YckC
MNYPSLFRRFLAAQVDILVVLFLLYLYGRSPLYDGRAETIWPMWLFLLYEPFFTRYGCTLGQLLMRFRVRTFLAQKKVAILRGVVRVCIKYLLGLLSFFLMPRQPQRRAIHDLIAGTIVLAERQLPQHNPSNQRLERP